MGDGVCVLRMKGFREGAGVRRAEIVEVLRRGAGELGVGVGDSCLEMLGVYCALVAEHGRRLGLTGARDARAVAEEHVLDSLALLKFVEPREGETLADVGSGAGFPGLALKIARPQISADLFEARSRKAGFLEHVVSVLGLDGVRVIPGRAEAEAARLGVEETFGIVTCRAVGKLAEVVEIGGRLVRSGGLLVSWKGRRFGEAELEDATAALGKRAFADVEIARYSLPYGAGERVLVMCRRR